MLTPDPRFDAIDGMDGPEFERTIGELLELLGFEVERIGGFDKGADLIATLDDERTAVQVKRHSGGVRIGAVRQVVDGRVRYECEKALVVTNSFFTKPAVECAEAHGIELWDRWKLSEYVEGDPPLIDTTVCAHCGVSVTSGVTKWCLSDPGRFGGNVYCMTHQRRSQRREK